MYDKTYIHYRILPGKIASQELHLCGRNADYGKWEYWKDLNIDWANFYNAFHKNPPINEKIVSWIYHHH